MLMLSTLLACISAVLAFPKLQSVPLLDGRIVGGKDADIKDYHYQLSLQYKGRHRCGAASISPTWVLTAAHCLKGISSTLLSIRAGSSYHNSGGKIAYLSDTIVHPHYNSRGADYDIALLRLSSALTSEETTPIALPPSGSGPSVGSPTNITGWGVTEEGKPSEVLQVVSVPVISQADCREAYSGKGIITDRMFCAGLLGEGGKDSCQGDSGGPLVINGALVGLVSWGIGCAKPNYPGVYTNLPVLREWIGEKTGI